MIHTVERQKTLKVMILVKSLHIQIVKYNIQTVSLSLPLLHLAAERKHL